MAKEKYRLPDVEGLIMEDVFNKLRLTKNGELTSAVIIPFGRDSRRFFTNAFVKLEVSREIQICAFKMSRQEI